MQEGTHCDDADSIDIERLDINEKKEKLIKRKDGGVGVCASGS